MRQHMTQEQVPAPSDIKKENASHHPGAQRHLSYAEHEDGDRSMHRVRNSWQSP